MWPFDGKRKREQEERDRRARMTRTRTEKDQERRQHRPGAEPGTYYDPMAAGGMAGYMSVDDPANYDHRDDEPTRERVPAESFLPPDRGPTQEEVDQVREWQERGDYAPPDPSPTVSDSPSPSYDGGGSSYDSGSGGGYDGGGSSGGDFSS